MINDNDFERKKEKFRFKIVPGFFFFFFQPLFSTYSKEKILKSKFQTRGINYW